MDPKWYKAAKCGHVCILEELPAGAEISEILQFKTPNGDTMLHIAVRHGRKEFAEKIIAIDKSLLTTKSGDGDTPLHIALRTRHSEVIQLLVDHAKNWQPDPESRDHPLSIENNHKDTVLHEAVRNHRSGVACELFSAKPNLMHMPNAKEETPLHIAAREGLFEVVLKMLQEDPEKEGSKSQGSKIGSPLQQAILGGNIEIAEKLLEYKSDFIDEKDSFGDNALHCAARTNNQKMAEFLLEKKPTLAYMPNNYGQPPLLIAAASGSDSVIKVILKNNEDAAEQVDVKGKNALHTAVSSGMIGSLKCLLANVEAKEFINRPDENGNTPLHLAAQLSRIKSSILLLQDNRVDPCIPNKEGLTARQIIESFDYVNTYEMYIWRLLQKSEVRKYGKKQSRDQAGPSRALNRISPVDEQFKSSAQSYTLVAALIATVTFAAFFTMPGGFNQMNGKALLTKHAAFKVFVISNTVAMCSSLVVVFCFIWAWKNPVEFKLRQLTWGHRLIVIACLAMIVTLMTGVYLTVAKDCLWLAIIVILLCCTAPVAVLAILGKEVLFIPVPE